MKEPNPGSVEARSKGCVCAVLDNNHGVSPPWPPDGWWITEGCPVHASKEGAVIQMTLRTDDPEE